MARTYVNVEVTLDEFEDDALIEAVVDRELVWDAVALLTGRTEAPAQDIKELVIDTMQHLMCGRMSKAEATLEAAVAAMLPPQIMPAIVAIREGRRNDAIIDLDNFIKPTPAATATKADLLKFKPAPAGGAA